MNYIPHTPEDIREMLQVIGADSVDSLFEDIPSEFRIKGQYHIPGSMSEPELWAWMQRLSGNSDNMEENACFMGAGSYQHFIPTLVDYLSGRSEFWTSYTPYQAEASQGNLQAIFEYQTVICELTAMDIANASMYDGPTAMAEAMLLSCFYHRQKRNVILLASTIHPEYLEVARTYMSNLGIELGIIPERQGTVDMSALASSLGDRVAAVVIASPNFFGLVEDAPAITELTHRAGALLVSIVNPISLGILEPPGAYGADIAVGDGQPLGIPPGYGGPSFGFFAANNNYLRQMPGRISGQTVDRDGKRGFVLTLQTREQHIRREKATSNICTNQALMALRSLIYTVCLGKEGFRELSEQCLQKAHYLAEAICNVPGFSLCYPQPFFHEFAVHCPKPAAEILSALRRDKIYGGIALSRFWPNRADDMLVSVTECRSRMQMELMVAALTAAARI